MSNTEISAVPAALFAVIRLLCDRLESWLDSERHQLPLGIPLALGAGMAVYLYLPDPRSWCVAIVMGLALALTAIGGGTWLWRRCLMWAGLLFAAGLGWAWAYSQWVAAPRLAGPIRSVHFEAEVLSASHLAARDQWRLIVAPRMDRRLPPRIRLSVRDPSPAVRTPGAVIALRARLMPPAGPLYPGGYDFARAAWFDRLGATGQALGPPRLVRAAKTGSDMASHRQALTHRLQQALPGDSGALAAALITGDRGGISEATNKAMRDSGLAHLLSISGLHIAALCGAVFLLIRRTITFFPRLGLHWPSFEIAALGAAVAALAYTWLAGMSVPTVRACLAAVIALLAMVIGRSAFNLRMVAGAALIIMLAAPDAAWGPSFQMSFLSIAGIIALYQEDRLALLTRGDRYDPPLYGLMRQVAVLAAAGLVAEMLLAPVALYHFGRASFYGVFSNIIAIPLTSFVILPLLALYILLDWAWLLWPLAGAMQLWIDLAQVTADLPGAVWHSARINDHVYLLWLIGIFWFLWWRTAARFGALLPWGAALWLALSSETPDMLVSGDGRHVIVFEKEQGWSLRSPLSDYHQQVFAEAGSVQSFKPMALKPHRCTADSCWWPVGDYWVLALKSDIYISRHIFEKACKRADIVIAPRPLPHWCRPRFRRLDHRFLAHSGGLLFFAQTGRIVTVAGRQGAHPWAVINSGATAPLISLAPAPDARDSAAVHKSD